MSSCPTNFRHLTSKSLSVHTPTAKCSVNCERQRRCFYHGTRALFGRCGSAIAPRCLIMSMCARLFVVFWCFSRVCTFAELYQFNGKVVLARCRQEPSVPGRLHKTLLHAALIRETKLQGPNLPEIAVRHGNVGGSSHIQKGVAG